MTGVQTCALPILARKEVRSELEGLKKASGQFRSDIAALKRQVAALEKQQARMQKAGAKKAVAEAEGDEPTHYRFSAMRLSAQRKKLGLSAVEMGTLVGVSAQTIYNWEAGKSRPRQGQLAAIAVVRKLGKREIQTRLGSQAE